MRSSLFSIDFLENHLEDMDDYKSLEDNFLKEKFKEISSYYKDDFKSLSEAQLESNFLQPVFKSLGHIYEVQTSKKSEDNDEGTKRIDYAFFYSDEDKETFHKNQEERNVIKFSSCSAICETKSWGLLDGYDKVKKNDNTDPIWQIKKSYLDNINPKEQKAKVPFGILTDGKSWRIYSYRAETDKFFELNLEEIIKNKDFNRFKIFWFFFSKEAFRGKFYLSSVESGSKKLQSQVSDELRKQVYLSLELIATGLFRVYHLGKRDWDEFKKYPEMQTYLEVNSIDEIDIENPETEKVVLEIIYIESLVYLFRILFLLYADHRNLFKHRKVESVFYQLLDKIDSYSQIGSIPEGAENISDKNDDYDINGVFEEIDREFNGGLFSTKLHPILNRFDIDNILYANAIDYLTRTFDKKTGKPQRVDFSVLEVRHLGTIYEGLLEYKLSKADKDTVIPLLSDKKKTRNLLKGDLFLVNDKGERKASGSYYTPDYIVECIVRYTVGPLIDAIEKENISIKEKILKILALRVLDPAMGSGHFLVEVINYINDRIEALIQNALEEFQNKVGRKSKEQAQLETYLKEAEEGLYKRVIAKKCIYGVDKNPMAVELAKLSIWIYTLQKNKKLEFFDYNLRCGDSLIGSQEKTFSSQLDSKAKERMLFASNDELYKNVVEDFKEEFKKYFEFENVEERMKYYESTIKPNQQKLKYLANIELALAFADKNEEIHSLYNAHKNKLLAIIRLDKTNEYLKKLIKGNNVEEWELKLFKAAKKVRDDYNPIHWELDFPNVFIDRGGFDAVVGNPPYFNIETFGVQSLIAQNIQRSYPEIWMDKSDIIFYFIAKAISISINKISFIVSNAFLFSGKAERLRNYILDNAPITKIINFEKYLVFDDASITTAIVEFDKDSKTNSALAQIFTERNYTENEIIDSIEDNSKYFNVEFKKNSVFALVNNTTDSLNNKIDKNYKMLNSLFKIGSGMQTAANHVFMFADYPKHIPSQFIKKRMSGEIIGKYKINGLLEYLLYFENVKTFDELPESIQNHLKEYKNDLENRATVKNEGRIWWRWSRPMHKEYYHLKKIWCSYRSKENIFCYDDTGEYIGLTNTTVIFDTNKDLDLKYLITLLNSKLLNYRYKSIGKQTGSGVYEYFENGVGKLPIPEISTEDQKPFIRLADSMLSQNKELGEVQKKFTKLLQSDLKIEKLSEKLEDWYLFSWDEFLAELKKKKIELKLDKKAEWMDFFEKEKAKALAVKDLIDRTDKEIDALVYMLYGLSEEEIAVVEGATK
jgi:hypothetical protein